MNINVTGHNPHDRSRGRSRGEMAKFRNEHPSDVNIGEGSMRPDSGRFDHLIRNASRFGGTYNVLGEGGFEPIDRLLRGFLAHR